MSILRHTSQPHLVGRQSAAPATPAKLRLAPLALASLAALLSACGGADGNPAAAGAGAMPPPEVAVVTVNAHSQAMQFEYVGQTAGSRETEVRARVAGILQKRLYVEGATVKAGTPLFQIDPANFQTQANATAAQVDVAQAKANQARRDFERIKPLIAEKAISQKEYDDVHSALESAEASLKQAKAQAQEARNNLGYTKVVAPIGGVTSTANKSDGSLVSATDSLLTTIVQTDPIYVNFSVSENDFLKLDKQAAAGQLAVPGSRASNGSYGFTVKVKLADGSIYPRQGKLNFASQKVNPQNGSFDARAEIPNPDGGLHPGQFVRVILTGATRPNTLSVPQRAVIDSPMGKMVFTVTPDNKLAPRPVELDGWAQGEWIVTKGLQNGDRVVADGYIKAHTPGMTVKPVPYQAASAAAVTPPTAAPVKASPAAASAASTATASASAAK